MSSMFRHGGGDLLGKWIKFRRLEGVLEREPNGRIDLIELSTDTPAKGNAPAHCEVQYVPYN